MKCQWAVGIGATALAQSCLVSAAAPAPTPSEASPPAEAVSAGDILLAVNLVHTGKVYSLAGVTGPDTPAYPGRNFSMHVAPVFVGENSVIGANRLTGHDDMVCTFLGIGTQIDGLGHVGVDGVYFGGELAADIWRPTGLKKFGIESVRPIVARGILLDLVAVYGAPLAPDHPVTASDIKAALKRQKLEIGTGDVVLIHTGWQSVARSAPETFLQTEPGLTMDAAVYLAENGAVAIGADNWGLEVIPPESQENVFPVHQWLIARRGIYILENIQTVELARDKAYEFLFVLAPPRLAGAVQGIVHPIAIR